MTNYQSQLVNHPHPGVVCCDTNSSSKLSHRKDDISKGLGYVLRMQKAVFVPQPAATATAARLCTLENGGVLSRRIGAMLHTQGSGLVIMMSHYHSFSLTCASAFKCTVSLTNTVNDYIHNYKNTFNLYSSGLYFGKKNVCLKIPPGTLLKQKDPFGV